MSRIRTALQARKRKRKQRVSILILLSVHFLTKVQLFLTIFLNAAISSSFQLSVTGPF